MHDLTEHVKERLVHVPLSSIPAQNNITYFPHGGDKPSLTVELRDVGYQADLTENIRFAFVRVSNASEVPVKYDPATESVVYLPVTSGEGEHRICLDLFFDVRDVNIDEWAHEKNVMLTLHQQFMYMNDLHMEGRALVEFPYVRADDNKIHLVMFRAWSNEQWPCTEHPELLTLAPMGQHHCGACGEMVVAGVYHHSGKIDYS